MAGDWIKMRAELQTHPKIVRILSATQSDKFRVIGGLHAVWSVFDTHSEDGVLAGYTPDLMDHVIGWSGFSAAMVGVGWLEWDGSETLVLPEFDEHNSKSAKRRAEDQKRKKAVRKMSADCPQPKRTKSGLDKREDSKPPMPPSGGVEGFEKFWSLWPKSDRKQAKGECLKAWKKANAEAIAADILAHVETMKASDAWRKNAGEFIPAPLVYLHQRRWEGAESERPSLQAVIL